MQFIHDIGGGFSLGLRTMDTAEEMHQLTLRNLDRLQAWEPWAHEAQTLSGSVDFTRAQLADFVAGTVLPAVIICGDSLIGAVSLRLNSYLKTAELGYWVDAGFEGRGAVSRACRALLEHADSVGVKRVEIRTAAENRKSAAVPERLGFALEGVLRSALPVGKARLDVALYARVQSDP
ncbi:GNAT family N-acetyltransferase [Arthrobacter gengyunqii]|uniref:GNAT family N-acetyltransferase n=1 Tax=Arthrobacter gengyunqii TaxID=2886940 RepID=A0A9X1M2N9_9MICC|nr:GNAT family protein [Arthrobacter gengyunqii]MCC3269852.1 GNAT family N-acetyltransferase [Arthrobacter gengyunqii]UOY97296.1 GNAT family N-acetyltransferase [Arthrobacter gengyunqii]